MELYEEVGNKQAIALKEEEKKKKNQTQNLSIKNSINNVHKGVCTTTRILNMCLKLRKSSNITKQVGLA
jgi:hypothetical protein